MSFHPPDLMLTITQALQLVGLVPSLFIVLFLLTLARRNRQAIVPVFYFLALSCHFALPLLDLHRALAENEWLLGGLLLGGSTLVAFTFLLIMQFTLGRVPPMPYWLVLAIPLVGGSPMLYAAFIEAGDACFADVCIATGAIQTLYNVFASSLVFLLLIFYASRASGISGDDASKRHKYWLVVSLILLHLFELGVDLARLSGYMTTADALFTGTMFRLTFIYLVLTSLFRVFYPAMAGQVMQLASPYVRAYHPELDRPHVEKIIALLETEHVYREMRLGRAALARKVGIGEHHLSRVINGHFGKSFSELINQYRVADAKRRLKAEPDQQITVIAFETGFNSIASFNRVFKSLVGVSPTEYRHSADNT